MPGRQKLQKLNQHIDDLGGDDVVFDQIAAGTPMEEIAAGFRGCIPQAPEFPHRTTMYQWIHQSEERERQWEEAKKLAAHSLVDESDEIVENKGPDGEPTPPATSAELGWIKMRAESRRQRAAKWNPEAYGEKQEQGVQINVDLGQLHLSALRSKGSMDLAPGREDRMLEAEVVEDED